MLRTTLLVLTALALAAPAAAPAANLSAPGALRDVDYTGGGGGGVRDVTVTVEAGQLTFEADEVVDAHGACTDNIDRGTCPAAGVSELYVGMFNSDDELDLGALTTIRALVLLGDGDDHVVGGSGGDTIVAGGDDDHVEAGGGNDTIAERAAGGVSAIHAHGEDHFSGEGGADTFLQNDQPTPDLLDGGAARDTVDYGERTARVVADLGAGVAGQDGEADTLVGVEDVAGGAGDDVLTGGDGPNELAGGAGDDALAGGTGNDQLLGGADDDVLDGGPGADLLVPGDGHDTLTYRSHPGGVSVSVDGVANDGGVFGENVPAGFDVLEGGAGADHLTGHAAGGEELRGLDGDDHLEGRGGADVLDGGPGADLLDGGAGADRVLARDGTVDTILCGDGDDLVIADLADAVTGCETVDRPPAPSLPPAAPAAPEQPAAAPVTQAPAPALRRVVRRRAKLRLVSRRADTRGRVQLRVSCPAVATVTCRGTAVIRRGRRTLGRARYAARPGRTRTVRVRVGVRRLRGEIRVRQRV